MLKEDRDLIKEMLMSYSCKEVMKEISELAIEVAGDMSDAGNQEKAKEFVKFGVALEDLIAGRPFLI